MGEDKPLSYLERLKQRARALKSEMLALYLAYRDPRVPLLAKWAIGCIVAYALSPIDLIPDFIPVLGYLDDLLIVPLGISLALRLMPPDVLAEYRGKAELLLANRPKSYVAATMMVLFWVITFSFILWRALR